MQSSNMDINMTDDVLESIFEEMEKERTVHTVSQEEAKKKNQTERKMTVINKKADKPTMSENKKKLMMYRHQLNIREKNIIKCR